MPLLGALLGGLLSIAGSLVGRVLLALGISYVVFSGTDYAVNSVIDGVKANMASMGGQAVQLLSYLWVDKALSMMFAAWVAALSLKSLGSNTFKKMVIR